MNTRNLIPLALAAALAFTGCDKKDPALTEAQKAQISQEVLQAAKQLFAVAEKVDLEGAMKFWQDSPDFAYLMPDGKSFTFAEARKLGAEMFGALASQKMVTQKEKVIVLAPDAALYTWVGRNDLVQKDGVVLRADPVACTYLYRKVDGKWWFAYAHESSLPFQPVKAEAPAAKK